MNQLYLIKASKRWNRDTIIFSLTLNLLYRLVKTMINNTIWCAFCKYYKQW